MVIVTEEQVRYIQTNRSKINTDSNHMRLNNIKTTKYHFFVRLSDNKHSLLRLYIKEMVL